MATAEGRVLDVEVPGAEQVFLAGEWKDGEGPLVDVICPSTEESVLRVASPTVAEADAAVAAARRAFDEGPWPRMSPAERAAVCTRLCEELEARLDDMNRAWTFEAGAPAAHGEMINSGAGRMVWRHAVDIAPGLPWEEDRTDALLLREPVGTVLAILTYNGPVVLMGMKVIPALLAGCPVIIKHAPESPLTARLVAAAVEAADFPPGVVSVLPAGTEVTQHLVSHDGVDCVALTGGTAIGVDVVKRTADRLARTALELGGKAPAIIAEDADLDSVMETLGVGASGFLGQVCVNLSRILAPRSRYDEVVAAMADHCARLKVGDPFDPATDRGPLAVERARDRTERYLEIARAEGAEVVTGGRRPPDLPRGWYFEPTVLAGVDNSMRVAQEEIFGPVISVIPYEDIDDAVAIANDTPYGLAASVYAADEKLALSVARRINAGGVAINLAGISLTQPFGGVKASGWGRECGPEGIFQFTELKQILMGGSYLDAADAA
jgi:aldehyde dehydrogenase (NAD+)